MDKFYSIFYEKIKNISYDDLKDIHFRILKSKEKEKKYYINIILLHNNRVENKTFDKSIYEFDNLTLKVYIHKLKYTPFSKRNPSNENLLLLNKDEQKELIKKKVLNIKNT